MAIAMCPSGRASIRRKVKNAQEAHEAIRPTSFARTPEKVARYLDADQARLYELIWKRALASQMESAEQERTTVDHRFGRRHAQVCAPPAQ